MITALAYLFNGIVVGIFAYKCYSIGYKNGLKNSFTNYLFWTTLLVAIVAFKMSIMVAAAFYNSNETLLFWSDITTRPLYYISSIFAVQIPLYKYYPNDKRRFIFSYIAGALGIALVIYQVFNRNIPTFGANGIIDWHPDLILTTGMGCLMVAPWAATSFIFIREYLTSKSKNLKSILLGFGFMLIVVGVFGQEYTNIVSLYITFNIISLLGYLFALAGLYYED
ncbi:MAG: hypothetical protein PHO93_00485 [Candidatus Saccharimonadaceae bacterium]|nr:hypothetical protein [Candidatus Saccharimonadaceae bacterium]